MGCGPWPRRSRRASLRGYGRGSSLLQVFGEGDELLHLLLSRTARDRLARALDAFLQRLRHAGRVNRRAGVHGYDVVGGPWLVVEDGLDHRPRLVHAAHLDRAAVVELEAELRGMDG